ncbi:hypothetical protein MHEI_46430 [Mycobacterium heidelbergense]|nr:hypothetical protein MHEI_46430 [Mycobacterium heidelbergense]
MARHATDMIAALAGRNGCEAMADFARLYPYGVFMDLYGLPQEDRDRVIAWKDAAVDGKPEGNALLAYFADAIQRRRQSPGPDMLSQVMADPGDLSDLELLGMSHLLILSGLDTVAAAIGFSLSGLSRRQHDAPPGTPVRLCTVEPAALGELSGEGGLCAGAR